MLISKKCYQFLWKNSNIYKIVTVYDCAGHVTRVCREANCRCMRCFQTSSNCILWHIYRLQKIEDYNYLCVCFVVGLITYNKYKHFVLQATFHYDANIWSQQQTYNPGGAETVFDTEETKLTSYWDTPFTQICLGMRLPGEQNINFLAINQAANSLYSLLADGQHRATSLGRDAWKTLIGSQASLQMNCNMEGFNSRCFWSPNSRVRIGFAANNQADCWTCDSRIGFGSGGSPDDLNTCGQAAQNGDNGNSFITAMCYLFVH